MKFIIFILPIACMASGYFYFDYKLSLARKEQMIASNQYIALREHYRKLSKSKFNSNIRRNINLSIKFLTPISKAGITKPNISLYIAPLYDSPNIKDINIRMEVSILDSAEINGETWFYVVLPIDSNVNCRGWINKNDFFTIYSNSRNVSKPY